jgi:hypothetical protein
MWGVEVYLHSFLTSALDGREWSRSSPGRFIFEDEPWYPLNKRLDVLEKRKISCPSQVSNHGQFNP